MSNSIKRPGDPLGEADSHTGLGYGLAAFIFWGFAPIYFKTVAHVSPIEMLAHRILFGALVLLIWLGRAGKLGDLRACLSDRATLGRLSLTTLLIGYNWFLYTYALMRDQVLQVSLGYYIYPLVNVCLGFVVLGERLRRVQWLAVGLATVGVFYLTFAHGGLPVLSLLLAGSFAVYGLLRKTARADAMVGLAIETLFLSPLALGTLVLLADRGRLSFTQGPPGMDLLIACAGLVTVLPLLWFTRAVRRLRLSTLGLLQYIAPSIQFLLAVAAFGELFTRAHGVAFSLIWTALVLYSLEAWWARPRSG